MAEEAFRLELERLRLQNEQLQAAFLLLEQRQQQPQPDVAAALASLPQILAGVVQAAVAAGPARPVERITSIDRHQRFRATAAFTPPRDGSPVELDPSTAANPAGAAAEPSLHRTGEPYRRRRRRLRSLAASAQEVGPAHHRQSPRNSQRNPHTGPCEKLSELQGAVERLEDLTRRHCVRKDTQTGARHACGG
eukprot:2181614-Amphidinium_carterae.1